MRQNIGDGDRTLRVMSGAILALIFSQMPGGTRGLVMGVVTIILLASSLTGWSLFYFIFRISTRSEKDAKPLDRS